MGDETLYTSNDRIMINVLTIYKHDIADVCYTLFVSETNCLLEIIWILDVNILGKILFEHVLL